MRLNDTRPITVRTVYMTSLREGFIIDEPQTRSQLRRMYHDLRKFYGVSPWYARKVVTDICWMMQRTGTITRLGDRYDSQTTTDTKIFFNDPVSVGDKADF